MEDEGRPLPQGWVRQYDPENHHQFFVDTTRDPPRSIWHHPYDDDEYLSTLDPKERQRIQSSLRVPSRDDIAAESSDEDRDEHPPSRPGATHAPAPTGPSQEPSGGALRLGRKLKDKITNTTHEQREEQRRQRAIAEQEAYEQHRKLRAAMVEAMRSGQPQLVGKDRNGKDVYIEPLRLPAWDTVGMVTATTPTPMASTEIPTRVSSGQQTHIRDLTAEATVAVTVFHWRAG